jgi:ATP:ADP antiporter, AAA family
MCALFVFVVCVFLTDAESKTKGKAAVEVIGNPLGKSGGSFVQQLLIGVFGSLHAATPLLGPILGIVIVGWIRAADSLNKQFRAKSLEMAQREALEKAEEERVVSAAFDSLSGATGTN